MKVEVCRKGHAQCFYVPAGRTSAGARCPVCGEPTLADCPSCGAPIGRRVGCEFVAYVWKQDLRLPQHCTACGRALPWAAGEDRAAGARGAIRAGIRRHLEFRAAYAARAVSGFTAGLAGAACALAGRVSGPAACMEPDGDGGYRITVASSVVRAAMGTTESGWVCDCPCFEGDAARCGHVWTAVLLGRARPLACRLGLPCEVRGPVEKRAETAATIERAVGDAVLDPAKFEDAALARIKSAWEGYLEWERFSNRDMDLSVGMTEADPGRAMHHAQQAVEKQIKALRLYGAAFNDKFSPRRLQHDIFVGKGDGEFRALLNKFGHELKELTMGIRDKSSRSRLMAYMGDSPSLVAYGVDIDEASAPMQMENLTLERHYAYLQASLAPRQYQPRELGCPTREYVSTVHQDRLDYRGGAERLAAQWDVDTTNMLGEFMSGAWKWRYYALYVHEGARYPSEFDPTYAQNADTVKKWVFEAGYMTCCLQDEARAYYAAHTYEEGDYLSRRMGTVRDVSWYEKQLSPDRR